ncbi:MAG: hypothetical protein JW720_06370 [Sedimentisphaerales bacterium]|nr:hypothetical protein [Sedimentisphaerales bacterium]
MKTPGTRSISTLVLVSLAACIVTTGTYFSATAASSSGSGREIVPVLSRTASISDRAEPQYETVRARSTSSSRTSAETVQVADFYLENGKLAFGKLVTEDRNKIIIEEITGSKVIVNTYSKRDIDTKTIQVKSISSYKHYCDLAEYFAGRTGDFDDDPDDFIQAIRFYERAKGQIKGASQSDADRVRHIDEQIAMLEADRKVWTTQVESRAKLKELEFQSEFQKRFDELQAKIDDSAARIDASLAKIDDILAEVKDNTQKVQKDIPAMEADLRRRMDVLGTEVEANRRLLDPYGRFRSPGYNSGRRY